MAQGDQVASHLDDWVQRGLFLGCTVFGLCEMGSFGFPSSDMPTWMQCGQRAFVISENEMTAQGKT